MDENNINVIEEEVVTDVTDLTEDVVDTTNAVSTDDDTLDGASIALLATGAAFAVVGIVTVAKKAAQGVKWLWGKAKEKFAKPKEEPAKEEVKTEESESSNEENNEETTN